MSIPTPTRADIATWLRLVVPPGMANELRILGAVDHPRYPPYTISGYYDADHLDELARIALEWTGKAKGCYITINPVAPDLLARAANRTIKKPKHTTTDAEIARRTGLVFDGDPKRPAGVSATAGEKAEAHERIRKLRDDLTRRGWPAPILADSGNGCHLRYAIDLPNDDQARDLVERVLRSVSALHSDDRVAIDTSLANAARIIKLYGTMARKGDHTDARPHRWSRVLEAPDRLEVVPIELLEALAAEYQPQSPPPRPTANGQPRAGSVLTSAGTSPATRARAYVFAPGFPESIAGQHGHDILYRVACELVDGFGLSYNQALPIFEEWNQAKARPPESDKQIQHKLADALKNHPAPSLSRLTAPLPSVGRGSPSRNGQAAAGSAPSGPPTFDGPPRAITVDLPTVPALDPRMIPASVREWLTDIAERGCFPLEYGTAAAIVGVSGLIGRRLAIRPKRRDHWLVVPNLWGAIVGPPGIQKSPPVEEALRPLRRLVADAKDRHAQAMTDWRARQLVAASKKTAAKDALKKAAGKKASEEELTELAREATCVADEEEPKERRYLVNDASIEKLGELMAENPSGLTWFRDELIGLLRTLDREGHQSDRGFLLESWSGRNSYTFDRIQRGTISIPSCCLAIFGTIQPGPLSRYLQRSISGEEADGFIPRFQILLYPDPPATFVNVDRFPETEAKNRAYAVFQAIDQLDPAALGCEVDEETGIPFVRFAPDAQEFFDEWRVELENRLRSGTLSSIMAMHLAKYRSLMPSLALEFHLCDSCPQTRPGEPYRWARLDPVPLQPAMLAAAWCELLESHAHRIYQSAMDGDIDGAIKLDERIRGSLPNPFSIRDVQRKGWSGLGSNEEVRRAIGILEDRRRVKVVEIPSRDPLGRGAPSEQVWIHPALVADGVGVDA